MRESGRLPSLALWGMVTALLVIGAFLLGDQVGRSRRPVSAGAGPVRPAEGEVGQEVQLLKARLRALERRPAPPATGAGLTARSELAAEEGAAPGGAALEPRPADEEDRRRYFLAIEERLASEGRDSRWADPLEDRLRRLAEAFPGQVTVLSARCARSLCRAELRRPAGPGAAVLTRELARQAAGVLPEVVLRSTDDPSRLVLYLQPEDGENFPPLTARGESGH